MMFFFQSDRCWIFLFCLTFSVVPLGHTASDDEITSYQRSRKVRSNAPSPSSRSGSSASEKENRHRRSRETSESSSFSSTCISARFAPHFLALVDPIRQSWELSKAEHIQPFIDVARQLERERLPHRCIEDVMYLGAQYIHAIKSDRLSIKDVAHTVKTLGRIEVDYPISYRSSSSTFAYGLMIDYHRNNALFPTVADQRNFLWDAAYVFHKKGGHQEESRTVLKYAPYWIRPWHYHQRSSESILDILSDIIHHAPTTHEQLLGHGSENFINLEVFEIKPVLEGILWALKANPSFSLINREEPQSSCRSSLRHGQPYDYPSPPIDLKSQAAQEDDSEGDCHRRRHSSSEEDKEPTPQRTRYSEGNPKRLKQRSDQDSY